MKVGKGAGQGGTASAPAKKQAATDGDVDDSDVGETPHKRPRLHTTFHMFATNDY